jgi:serine/threonine-protein kinase
MYGKVFKVFDDQDSGNICFGMTDGTDKYFVKFAGAPTVRANVSAEEAVERMKNTVQIYRDLAHPVLTRFIDAVEIGSSFTMVFEWTDAECMSRQYPKSREKFMQMPMDKKLRVFDEVLAFHNHAAKQGYVAIDFYDGCIMFDFDKDKTIICDIELYEKVPAKNNRGRMYGSSRFMSPEEFKLGETIDEITNVYTMGATAFALFGDEERRDRRIEDWKLSKGLYDIAKRAVSNERSNRQQSLAQFISEWQTEYAQTTENQANIIRLELPNESHKNGYLEMMDEWLAHGGRINPGALRNNGAVYEKWLKWLQ